MMMSLPRHRTPAPAAVAMVIRSGSLTKLRLMLQGPRSLFNRLADRPPGGQVSGVCVCVCVCEYRVCVCVCVCV